MSEGAAVTAGASSSGGAVVSVIVLSLLSVRSASVNVLTVVSVIVLS